MIYFFFRVLFVPLAFVTWIIFELGIKKKNWSSIKNDVLVGGFFVVLASLFFFYMMR